jgi:hypothetical protein
MAKKMRVWRTHTMPKSAASAAENTIPPARNSSIEVTPR